jgi:hypothetical protein
MRNTSDWRAHGKDCVAVLCCANVSIQPARRRILRPSQRRAIVEAERGGRELGATVHLHASRGEFTAPCDEPLPLRAAARAPVRE